MDPAFHMMIPWKQVNNGRYGGFQFAILMLGVFFLRVYYCGWAILFLLFHVPALRNRLFPLSFPRRNVSERCTGWYDATCWLTYPHVFSASFPNPNFIQVLTFCKNSYEQNTIIAGNDFAILTSFIRDTKLWCDVSANMTSRSAVLCSLTCSIYEECSISEAAQVITTWGHYSGKGKGKAIPLQAWTCPAVCRSLRLPDFKTIGTWRWQGCQPCLPSAFTPHDIFLVLFC